MDGRLLLLVAAALTVPGAHARVPLGAYVVRLQERLSPVDAVTHMSNLFFEPESLRAGEHADSAGRAVLTRVAGHDVAIERRWSDGAWHYRVDRDADGDLANETWLSFTRVGSLLAVATVELAVPGAQVPRVVMRVLTSADGYVYGRAAQEWVGTLRVSGTKPARVLIRPAGRMTPLPAAGVPYDLLIDRDGDGTFRDVADSTPTGQPRPTELVRPDQPFRVGEAVLSIHSLQLKTGRLELRDDPARTGVSAGLLAPAIASHLLDGTPVSFAQLRGKPAVIEFWSVHCPYSEQVRPQLASLAAQFGDRVQWVAMAREADEDTLRQHLRAHPMAATPWRHVADTWALYNPSTITPLFVVVDADGRIRGIEPGARALAYLAAELRALIDESGTLPSSRH